MGPRAGSRRAGAGKGKGGRPGQRVAISGTFEPSGPDMVWATDARPRARIERNPFWSLGFPDPYIGPGQLCSARTEARHHEGHTA